MREQHTGDDESGLVNIVKRATKNTTIGTAKLAIGALVGYEFMEVVPSAFMYFLREAGPQGTLFFGSIPVALWAGAAASLIIDGTRQSFGYQPICIVEDIPEKSYAKSK
jgi:hypothetical protein